MIKIDIVKRVADQLKLKDREGLTVVDTIIDAMKETIREHGRLEVRNFGVFQIKTRKPRTGRNPRNKKEYPIHPRKVVTFKLGKELKDFSIQGKDLQSQPASRRRKSSARVPATLASANDAVLAKPQAAPAPKMTRPAPIIQQTSFLPLEGESVDLKEDSLD